MQMIEFNVPAEAWAGLNTRYDVESKLVNSDEFTEGSINYELSDNGSAIKRPSTEVYNPTPLASPIRDEFEMVFQSGVRHKLVMSNGTLYYTTGNGVFNSVASGFTAIANMEFASYANRVYFGNGFDRPRVYDIGTTYGGVTYTPPTVANMGVTAPSSAPTVGSPTSGGSVPAGTHTYKVTFLYYDTQESNGSIASGTVTVSTNHTVPLSAIPVGGLGVTARKIYRDDNDGLWALVGTISNNTATTFSDTVALGTTPIPTDNNTPPTWSLVVQYRDRLWVSGVSDAQTTLYYSDAGLPDVWPVDNFIGCNPKDTITALASYNDRVVVFGKASFGMILGTTSRDFRYIDISPNIGCIDNRSIQIITVLGVPKLQWLSAYGIYQWDGSNLQLVSDKINNLLKFNIQQASGTTNKNIQSTQADFQAGTASPGIDLTSIPGSIALKGYLTTTNPTKEWDSENEWEAGVSLDNIATHDGSNTLKTPINFAQSYDQVASTTGLIVRDSNANITLAQSTDFTGYTGAKNGHYVHFGDNLSNGAVRGVAIAFTPDRSGVLNTITFDWSMPATAQSVEVRIYGSDGTQPVGLLATSTTFSYSGNQIEKSFSFAISLTGGIQYWAVLRSLAGGLNNGISNFRSGVADAHNSTLIQRSVIDDPWSWGQFPDYGWITYTFTSSPIAASGQAITTVYDSFSESCSSVTIRQDSTLPTNCSSITTVYGADDENMSINLETQVFHNLNGEESVTLVNHRYWFITTQLNTTDNRNVPLVSVANLKFSLTGTWISEVIDHTAGIVSLDLLSMDTSLTPSGTSAVVTIATSTDNITYSSYTSIGLATPRRYSKIKVVLTSLLSGSDIVSAVVSNVIFNWTIAGNLISQAINTVVTPAGWGLFQATDTVDGGTIVYEVRSAVSSGTLGAASWFTATVGQTIPAPIHPWIQWRVTLTASAGETPSVQSITLNWLITNTVGIRVASLFYNQTYYLAAAEFGQTTNNIVLYYDWLGRWGQFNGLNISTMGLFFGSPYFGDAIVGDYTKWLDPSIINNDAIEFDIRTKSFSGEIVSDDKTKLLRHMIVTLLDTSATITPYYSTDLGITWNPMVNVTTGLTNYVGLNTNKQIRLRFTPQSGNILWGYGLMFRIYNNDSYPVEIMSLRTKVIVTDRPVLLKE